jgi:tetratricopeptide (TPR) repeat protein
MLDSSLKELRRLLGDTDPDVRAAMDDLLMVTFDSVAARSLLVQLAELDRTAPAKDPIAIAEQLNQRGTDFLASRRYADAVALFRASLEIVKRQLPAEHSDTRTVQRNLAVALEMNGQLAAAESLQRVDLAIEERLHRPTGSRGMAHEALALLLARTGRLDSAEAHERQALDAFRSSVGPTNWRIWSAQRNIAIILSARGRPADGLALLDSAIALARAGPDSLSNGGYLTAQRAPFLIRLGRVSEAARAIALAEGQMGALPSITIAHRADVNRYAGMVELALGNPAGAVQRFQAAVALVESPRSPPAVPGLGSCLLGVGLSELGRVNEAAPLLDAPCKYYLANGPLDSTIVGWIAGARRRISAR